MSNIGKDFFKNFNIGFKSPKKFMSDKKTVCVKYIDGKVIEHKDISTPWRYITSIKKNINVANAWIKK